MTCVNPFANAYMDQGRPAWDSPPPGRVRYTAAMPDRSSKKRPADLNKLAASIVADAVSEEPDDDPYDGKNPAAVELGRQGGLKGGKARAEKLTPEQRSEIARKAAAARWGRGQQA